jgi:hypothetical protein
MTTDRERERLADVAANGGANRDVHISRDARRRNRDRRVDRVAVVIWAAEHSARVENPVWPVVWGWDGMPDDKKRRYRRMAEAAIEALKP